MFAPTLPSRRDYHLSILPSGYVLVLHNGARAAVCAARDRAESFIADDLSKKLEEYDQEMRLMAQPAVCF